jgi:3-hydroxybutyryl-CoA dehydrogenase
VTPTDAAAAISSSAPVGILGAGTMGSGIAQVALEAGHQVRIFDPDNSAAVRSRSTIADGLGRRAAKRGLAGTEADRVVDDAMDRLAIATSPPTAAADAALVIEAAIEDLAVKRELFRALDAAAPPTAILATNTSALRVAAIADATTRPDRVIGLHFFNPAALMLLVEVVATPAASSELLGQAAATMRAWGKEPVRSADTPGFIVNRVNRPFTIEALRAVEAGEAAVPEVDAALRAAGFPMGPFELMDLVGIDVNLAAARGVWEGFDKAERFRPSPIQERLVAAGRLGRKTGAGFYRYGEAGERREPLELPPDVAPPRATRAASAEEIADRIVLAVVNEAYLAVGENVATKNDVDRALELGAGHSIGPFERVERLGGPAAVSQRLTELARQTGRPVELAPLLVDSVE